MFIGLMGWIIVGLLAGFVATKLVNLNGDDPRLGLGLAIVGAIAGGILYAVVSGNAVEGVSFWSLFSAAAAAMVALVVWHGLRYRSAELDRRRQPRGRRFR